MNTIFQLNQAPVNFQPHRAVQRDVVLSTAWRKEESQNDELSQRTTKLVNSVITKTLPIYLTTNLEIEVKWPGLYKLESNDVPDRWQTAFWFLQKYPEIERVALVDSWNTQMLQNPFPNVEEGKIYVADELNDFSNLNTMKMPLEDVSNFIDQNATLQILNPAVIVGTREMVLEFLGLLLNFQRQINVEEKDPYTLINLFNYVLYRYFDSRVIHGRLVSSIMGFQQSNSDAWFKCD